MKRLTDDELLVKEIQAEIRELKRDMKREGIRIVSCMNGGLTTNEWRCNARLFQLSVNLSDAKKRSEAAA